jgi:F0F1-type ATP synthase assembly protein I
MSMMSEENKKRLIAERNIKLAAELEKKATEEFQKKADKEREDKKVTLDQAGKAVKKSFLWGLGIGALITVIIYKIRN